MRNFSLDPKQIARRAARNKLQLRARKWLIREDPTPERFWEGVPLTNNFVQDVRQNLYTFGSSPSGRRIVDAYDHLMGKQRDRDL